MDFYRCSNTHDPDQDGFEDLYHRDFIHVIRRVARHKLARHQLDPYQHAAFHHGIVRHNMGEEEADPTLELAMEYTSALGTIIFDESCRLRDLTKAQVGRNQFVVDVAVDHLDGEADHAAEHIGALEDKVAVIITVVWHDFRSTLSLFLLSPTLHLHSLILSFSLSYLST